jgi:hypothetical protein
MCIVAKRKVPARPREVFVNKLSYFISRTVYMTYTVYGVHKVTLTFKEFHVYVIFKSEFRVRLRPCT